MRKGSAIGIAVGVVFMSIIVGIAAIPDEVLEISRNEKMQIPSVAAEDILIATVPEKSVVTEPEPPVVTEPEPPVVTEPEPPVVTEPEPPVVTEPEPPVVTEPEPPTPAEPENSENAENQSDESKNNVIRVKISDGVGASQR
jgi:outer membrane biosynthesis protein TonB